MKANIERSQRRKLPLIVMPIRTTAATGTEIYELMPK
jgi:hypothetical protein